MIEEITPGTKTKIRIVKTIYENPGINLTSLIRRVKASPNSVLEYVNKLSKYGIIKEIRLGGKKRIHIRSLLPNLSSEIAKLIFSIIEEEKKLRFFEKYKTLRPLIEQLYDLFGENIRFALIYGSYARFAATKESDLDILIVGKLDNVTKNRIDEIFITSEVEPSVKTDTLEKFIENKEKPLYQNILMEHVIIFGSYEFVSVLEKIGDRKYFSSETTQ